MFKRIVAFFCILFLVLANVSHAEEAQLTSIVTFGLDFLALPGYDHGGKKIVTIRENAFAGQNQLRVLALPTTIRSIDDRAFVECKGLNGILIPETVVEFGNELFQDGGERVTIIAPAGSAAIRYAQENDMRFLSLKQHTLAEADERYIALLMFVFAGNSNYFSKYSDTDTYLISMDSADTFKMGLTNRMELAWNTILGFFSGNDRDSYMVEQYMQMIGSLLEDMHGMQSITIDTGLFQKMAEFGAQGSKSYDKLVTWLHGAKLHDDPFVKSIVENGDKLEYLAKALGGFDKVMNILLYACRDYSESIIVLNSLLEVSAEHTDQDFYQAVYSLKQLYEGNVTGMLSSLLSEFYVDIGETITDGVIKSISSGALLLYNLSNFGIDFALSVEGIKQEADDQMNYITLLNICDECEESFTIAMNSKDYSPEMMTHLDVLIQLCRAIRLRIYDVQIDLFRREGNTAKADDLSWSRAYYHQNGDIIGSYVIDLIPRLASENDKLTTAPLDHSDKGIMSADSLSSYWLAQPGKYIYSMTEYGYQHTENVSQASLDGIAVGEMGHWYLEDSGTSSSLEMIEEILAYDLYACDVVIELLQESHNFTECRLLRSELFKEEEQIWEDYGDGPELYVSELWTEFYLFSGSYTENIQPYTFELLIMLNGSSEGENHSDAIVRLRKN